MKKIFQKEIGTAEILGVRVNLVDYAKAISAMKNAIYSKVQLTIAFVNVYSIMTAQKDAELKFALNNCSLSVPDGMPLVWISRWTDNPLSKRVYGPDLFKYFCELSKYREYSYFFYGSSPLVLQRLKQTISGKYPNINVVGSISPPYRPINTDEENRYIEKINRGKPDVLWIGLGCPKQEKLMNRIRCRVEVPVIASIGAAFDFHSGNLRQAPKSLQNSGLEWLFRLSQEPRRLAFRYLLYNPLFMVKIASKIIKSRS